MTPQPGSMDNHQVKIIRGDAADLAVIIAVYRDGNVIVNGQYSHNKKWVAETLGKLIEAIESDAQ